MCAFEVWQKQAIVSYDLNIEAQRDHISVRVSGARIPGHEVEDSVHVWKQVADTCRDTGIERVLATFELTGHLSPIDAYEIVAGTEEFGWSHAFRLAVVDLNEDTLQDNLFAETVAVNRAYQIRVFDRIPAAKKWLLNP